MAIADCHSVFPTVNKSVFTTYFCCGIMFILETNVCLLLLLYYYVQPNHILKNSEIYYKQVCEFVSCLTPGLR